LWALGKVYQAEGGYKIYKWEYKTWVRVSGKLAMGLSADANGGVYIYDKDGKIWKYSQNQWSSIPGEASDIAVTPNDILYFISTQPAAEGGLLIYTWDGQLTNLIEGGAV
jgi:hypothetical protein